MVGALAPKVKARRTHNMYMFYLHMSSRGAKKATAIHCAGVVAVLFPSSVIGPALISESLCTAVYRRARQRRFESMFSSVSIIDTSS